MTDTEKAYIAGIIDGEGSITLVKQHKNRNPSPMISVASTDLELLIWMKKTINGGTIIKKKNYNPENHLNSYVFNLTYNKALKLLQEIEPYLVIERKKQRARLLINEYKQVTPRNGKYNEELAKKREKFYKTFISL
ncbi:hypothetical protein D2962_13565 [Biomaibacter acetigenes]|uniref:Homing endonuclease LAGLIDADG domain-containing protein n=1 Tax=Biomaibacter acetigenes TaxID=2316383 RepID=A0A3G2R8Y5_9FIRM|nr:LAGLIDADG family homing endonuclease [Biomaibacter acetigenes]AYO31488.1 hypothetical protein D2962_13565 [Biomaibacter acetigenes]